MIASVGTALLVSASLGAQAIPVVDLPAPTVKSAEAFGAILNVRELPGGRLLVDDGKNRVVKLLTNTLTTERVVLDSALDAANTYGNFPLALIPFTGDSTLYPSVNKARGVFVIDPNGNVVRTLAMPRVSDVALMRRGFSDDKGRVVFMGQNPVKREPAFQTPPILSDSAPLLRADFVARTTDTIAWVARPYVRIDALTSRSYLLSYWENDPLKAIDEWTVLTDGSIAMVRGHDYRVDWLRSNGAKESSAKLPFEWKQMGDAQKTALIDTVQAQWAVAARNNTLLARAEHSPTPWSLKAMTGSDDPNAPRRPYFDSTQAVRTNALLNGPTLVHLPDRPKPDDVYDYYAPIRVGGAMADLDNHLWLLPTLANDSKQGELVYNVVNTNGQMTRRVRAPLGKYIIGFGKNGVVYLASGDLTKGFVVERSKLP